MQTVYSSISDTNLANAPTMTQTVGGTTLELVALPLTTEVLGEDPSIMLLEFQDVYGETYSFAANYALADGELTLTAPDAYVPVERETETESSGIMPNVTPIQHAISTISSQYGETETGTEAPVQAEGDVALLTDSLTYSVSMNTT